MTHYRPPSEKQEEHQRTSNWSIWWKHNSPIRWIYCLKYNSSKTITLNNHSKLSKDLATFMFCSSLPDSYKATTWQYLDNITVIANYKLSDIIAWVLQEESRRKAQALGQGSSLNKFSTVKNIGQKCVKCGKMNHTTQNHWPGGNVHKRARDKNPKKCQDCLGRKKQTKRGKEKKRDKWVPMY